MTRQAPFLVCALLVASASALLMCACDAGSGTSAGGGGSGATAGSGGAGNGPPTLDVVPGAPTPPPSEPDTTTATVEGYVSAVGANDSLVAIGTTVRAYDASPQGLTELPIVGDEPDLPLETGAIRAIAPYQDGLLIAADNALFFTNGGALQLSQGNDALHPLGITAITTRIADDDGDGTSDLHLTIAGSDAAYELTGESMTKWTVGGESGAPTAAFAQKDRVYVAFGHHVYEIDKASQKAYPLIFDVGFVTSIACDSLACEEGSLLYFATDEGLAERGSDGGYSLYPLAEEGAAPLPVESFAFDAGRQRLYAIAGDWVLRVHAGVVPEAVATVAKGDSPRRMAFDKLGDLWAGQGSEVQSFALGTPLSFASDVKPILHEYCAFCHTGGDNGAPVIDFEDYDTAVEFTDKALSRIADGSMPPPGYPGVPKEKLQILQDWAPTKAP